MKKLVFTAFSALLFSCGPERSAKEVCTCYDEVFKLKGDDATKKMTECLLLLEKYDKKYKGTSDYAVFSEAYNKCR